jgi:mono/diheme cytochrome c family protein
VRTFALALAAAAALTACRGQTSDQPPIHIVPDMDWQPRYNPQGESAFFEDHRAMRPLVAGTVAQGELREDTGFHTGKVGDLYLAKVPFDVNEQVLSRGQQRFNIYCTPCHDQTGSGNGVVIQRGYPIPVNLASEHTRGLPDGEIFEVISRGVRNMPAYNTQIPEQDRWAIVSWVRVLQRSQAATVADVPAGTQIQEGVGQ